MSTPSEVRCVACGEGNLRLKSYFAPAEYKGVHKQIPQQQLRCEHCNAELYDDACGRFNRRAYVAFQKSVEGLPSGAEIKALRKAFGLSSEEAGRLLGGGPKAFSKYENDEHMPSGAMRTLWNYLSKYPERLAEVLEANGHDVPEHSRQHAQTGVLFDLNAVAHGQGTVIFKGAGAVPFPLEIIYYNAPGGAHLVRDLSDEIQCAGNHLMYGTASTADVSVASEPQLIPAWGPQKAYRL